MQRRSGNQTPRSFGSLLCFGHTVDFGSSDGIEEIIEEDDDTSVAELYILPIIANISCPYAILTSARIQPGFLPHFSRETKVPIRHRTHSQDTTPDRFPTNIVSTSRHFPLLPAQVGFVQEQGKWEKVLHVLRALNHSAVQRPVQSDASAAPLPHARHGTRTPCVRQYFVPLSTKPALSA